MYAERTEKATSEKDKTGIPRKIKTRFEQLSGFSFDDVRVHYNSEKPAQLRAHAYTQGNEVYVAPGQEKHLPHELGHVVQQKSDTVKPTGEIGGLPLNDDKALENGADMIAENAENAENFGGKPVQAKLKGDGVVQRADLHSSESYNLHAGFLSTLIGGVGAAVGIGSSIYSSRLERKRLYEGEVEKYAEAACEAREEQIAAVKLRDSSALDDAEKIKAAAEVEKLRAKVMRNYETAIKKAIKMGALENDEKDYSTTQRIERFFRPNELHRQDNGKYNADNLSYKKIDKIEELNIKNALYRAKKAYEASKRIPTFQQPQNAPANGAAAAVIQPQQVHLLQAIHDDDTDDESSTEFESINEADEPNIELGEQNEQS